MGIYDREYGEEENPQRPPGAGGPGGDWRGIRPSFDNPFSWSVPLGRLWNISVRVHIIFLIFVVVELIRALLADGAPMHTAFVAMGMASLFLVVLLHEFGHCFACRWWGGEADEILMWPLGGLAYVRPPQNWQAHMATVLGGPAVNVVICIILGAALLSLTGEFWGVALPNPLNLGGGMAVVGHSWPLLSLYWLNAVSLILLLFNLLPMFPLDGGRLLQSALWPRMGYVRSMRIAVRVGFVGAVMLGIFGLVWREQGLLLVLIAVFGGITCWLTHRQLAFTEEMMGGAESDDYAMSLAYGSDADDRASSKPARPTRAERRAERRRQREAEEAAEVDRILQKIAESGMESLSRRERKLLQQVTERKRKQR